jgi:TonB family protein
MNTTFATALVVLLIFAGCAAPELATVPPSQTELVSMTPLPPITSMSGAFGIRLVAVFRVLPDGSTAEVTLMRSSGDKDWDRPAIDSMKQWHFVPLTGNTKPEDRLIRLAVIVQVQDPVVMQLAEMVITSKEKADSLYALLKEGADFDALAASTFTTEAVGTWKPRAVVNVVRYPGHVRDALCTLRSNQVSEPIRVGLDYLIFKKYKADN